MFESGGDSTKDTWSLRGTLHLNYFWKQSYVHIRNSCEKLLWLTSFVGITIDFAFEKLIWMTSKWVLNWLWFENANFGLGGFVGGSVRSPYPFPTYTCISNCLSFTLRLLFNPSTMVHCWSQLGFWKAWPKWPCWNSKGQVVSSSSFSNTTVQFNVRSSDHQHLWHSSWLWACNNLAFAVRERQETEFATWNLNPETNGAE